MTLGFQGFPARATAIAAGSMTAFWGAAAIAAEDRVGRPTNWAMGLQAGVTPLRNDAIFFHNIILMPIITAITLLVLFLIAWIAIRYNKRANPIPARWSHNTPIEIIWTVVPVLILMFIAIFSFRLLYAYHDMPKPDLTVKATGYQWYWGYEYPDQKVEEFVSNMLPENKATEDRPFKLAANDPLVVPVNKTVRVLVTGADVIHAFAVPAFGIITDAVPGRVNETWFKANRIGTYFGNCRELCGVDHAFMPIEVRVVSQADFDAWVASKGGSATAPVPAGAAPPAESVAPAIAPAGPPSASTAAGAAPTNSAPATTATPAPPAPAAK